MHTEKELALKHGALVSFSASIGSIHEMPWWMSQRVTEVLANTGKRTKDLTLFDVQEAINTVSREMGVQDATFRHLPVGPWKKAVAS